MSDPILLSNLIDGQLRAPARAALSRRARAGHRRACSRAARIPTPTRRRRRRRRRAARRARRWAATPAEQRARLLESPRRPASSATRSARRARIARLRQAGQARAHAGHPARGRQPALLRRGDHAMGQRSASRWTARALNYTLRQPLGVVALHLAVEPAAVPVHLEDRAGAGGRQRGRRQAVGNHAVHRGAARRACDRSRLSAGRAQHRARHAGPASARRSSSIADVKAISFTGSTRTGAAIAAAAAPQFKKLSLEMGGKNPAIVFADADLSEANLDTIVRSGFANQGEICLCGSRLLVSARSTTRSRSAISSACARCASAIRDDAASDLGALVSQAHFDKVHRLHRARARRRRPRALRRRSDRSVDGRCADGWFVAPTVIEGLAPRLPRPTRKKSSARSSR